MNEIKPERKHKNKFGDECKGNMALVSLGHTFISDILKIEPPHFSGSYGQLVQMKSFLYALLEGASDYLEIDRSDINGCIAYESNKTVLVLYDEAAGGAGHVKRIARNLDGVLRAALQRVDGRCGCSEDTSCYACLRNYGNQFDHENIIRGAAREYLEALLK